MAASGQPMGDEKVTWTNQEAACDVIAPVHSYEGPVARPGHHSKLKTSRNQSSPTRIVSYFILLFHISDKHGIMMIYILIGWYC